VVDFTPKAFGATQSLLPRTAVGVPLDFLIQRSGGLSIDLEREIAQR